MSSNIKLAHIKDVLLQSAQLIRDLATENVRLSEKLAAVNDYDMAERILDQAEAKGLDLSPVVGTAEDRHEKIAAIIENADDLGTLATAVSVQPGDLSFATLGGKPGSFSGSAEADFIGGLLDE